MILAVLHTINASSLLLAATLFLLSLLWLLRHANRQTSTNANIPPFPATPLPVVGHLHLLRGNLREKMAEWRRISGGIYCLYFGQELQILVGDFSIIKEIMTKHGHFVTNTARTFISKVLKERNKGIVFARDENWKIQRSISLSILRSFGMGSEKMADKIQLEIRILIKELSSLEQKPVDLQPLLSKCITNIISSVTFGERFELNDPRLARLVNNASDIIKYSAFVMMLTSFKLLRKLPGDLFHIRKWAKIALEMTDFTRTYIERCKHSSVTSDLQETFISAYLDQMRKANSTNGASHLSEDNLKSIVRVLFVAGTESSTSTILWCLLYMLHHKQAQEKVYTEIAANIPPHRLPNLADKAKLVYLNAVILETQRIVTVVPTGQRREVSSSFAVQGFSIPKGSIVWPINFLVHQDKDIWGDPENFRPERFISSDGIIQIPEEFIPFGIGKRICIGESLARMELFLFLAALFQRFKFEPADENGQLPTLNNYFASVCRPKEFLIRAIPRDY